MGKMEKRRKREKGRKDKQESPCVRKRGREEEVISNWQPSSGTERSQVFLSRLLPRAGQHRVCGCLRPPGTKLQEQRMWVGLTREGFLEEGS